MTARLCPTRTVALAVVIAGCTLAAAPAPASALNPVKPICSVGGWFSGIVGKVCTVAQHAEPDRLGGQEAGSVDILAARSRRRSATEAQGARDGLDRVGLAAIGAWVLGGAKFALHETAKVLGSTTRPQLPEHVVLARPTGGWPRSPALLTLPFLFAAAVQAMMRSDLGLLARAALRLPAAWRSSRSASRPR